MTMLSVAIFFGLIVLVCSTIQNQCTRGLLHCLEGARQPDSAAGAATGCESFEPQAVVILCLRGSDPQLNDCLTGLLNQEYQNWELRIVVDHVDDPALHVVETCLARQPRPNVTVQILETRYETCSLKLSALSQELAILDDNCEAVVLVDADVMTYPRWLKDMLSPLKCQNVGATTGLRWFAPEGRSVGASVRYLWNLGALGQMHRFGIAWGGSLALKADFVRNAELSRQWSQMAFEDTAILNSLKTADLQLRFVPQAVMVNTESIGIADSIRYVRRQMLNARLYHPAWMSIFVLGMFSALGTAGSLATLCAAILERDWTALGTLAGLLSIAAGTTAFFAARLETSVRQSLRTRLNRQIGSSLFSSMIYLVPLQLIYGFTLLAVLKQRTVKWRGIRYQIEHSSGAWQVQMDEYQPMIPTLEPLSSIS